MDHRHTGARRDSADRGTDAGRERVASRRLLTAWRPASGPVTDGSRGTLTAVTLAMFCLEVSFLALMLALPDMARLFRNSPEVMQDALSAYLLSFGAALVVAGRIGDILGRRRLFVVGCLLFIVTLVGSALSPSLPVLVAFRVLQGAAAGLVLPSGIALVTASYPGADRQAKALGLCFALAATGSVVGPLFGGWLTEGPGWPWTFWLLVPLLAAVIVLAVLFVPESRIAAAAPPFDLVGAVMVVVAVAAIGTGIDRADSVGWSGVNIALLVAGLVIIALFPIRSRRAPHPLVDVSVFGNPRFALLLFLSSVGAACYAATIFVVSVYLQDARGLTAVRASLLFAVMAVLQALAAPVGARLQRRNEPVLVLAGAGALSGAALIALTTVTSWWAYVPVLALCGFGLGLEYAVASIASQRVVGPDRAGEVSGIVLTLRTTAAGISLAAAASIIEAVEHAGRSIGAASDVTLLIVASLSLGASLIAAGTRYVLVRQGVLRPLPQRREPRLTARGPGDVTRRQGRWVPGGGIRRVPGPGRALPWNPGCRRVLGSALCDVPDHSRRRNSCRPADSPPVRTKGRQRRPQPESGGAGGGGDLATTRR